LGRRSRISSIGVIANQKKGEAALDVYERIERVETARVQRSRSRGDKNLARHSFGTGMVRIPLGADSKPSDSAAYRAELEGLARVLAVLVNDSDLNATPWKNMRRKRKKRTS